ncbi:MAG: hypothetical protein LBG74_03055 [Spirochaetaceae bacterium]|jgi:hypothetical protein|nr:hypothetical protein [Spirochaetaceae bacterium]
MKLIAAGAAAGICAALARIYFNKRLLMFLVNARRPRAGLLAAAAYLLSLATAAALLVVCIKINLQTFFGCAAGLVTVPLGFAALTAFFCRKNNYDAQK